MKNLKTTAPTTISIITITTLRKVNLNNIYSALGIHSLVLLKPYFGTFV
jgi:hypothetical protein